MMQKNAMYKTLEAFLAVSAIMVFVAILATAIRHERADPLDIMPSLMQDRSFRGCIVADDIACADAIVREYVQQNYDFLLVSSRTAEGTAPQLPAKNVWVESTFVAGNETVYRPRIVRLYYWKR
ncbi:hypothetical protein COY28_04695 [Candidatus Woesearchaeota archaeon CG_4_10_14_0_2_um_filter_57_5]|nr:MAG: hypothetical protein AUJ68_04115 [Candidatus Woesearchaeota archaeon CG1_02_57_44]PIN71019.1 MAG: hypothetical protein COV94_00020 [Candidatus Woesearchaeota archaeon CG11_big_fil_rev_8_21_14_0_20_57_5]PIZ51994.1 MAG: hypothetical protein COY28_04695 [Candidatus Woesearchaeota archaeon CG_4_10_14_0_2_um_filter_57_5]